MAIKLDSADTHLVLTSLHEYREALVNLPSELREHWHQSNIEDLDRLIKSYRRSLSALSRLDLI